MIIDISKITLQNINEYQNIGKKQRKPRGIIQKGKGTFDMKEYRKTKQYRDYQHNYYLNVTKLKRKGLLEE